MTTSCCLLPTDDGYLSNLLFLCQILFLALAELWFAIFLTIFRESKAQIELGKGEILTTIRFDRRTVLAMKISGTLEPCLSPTFDFRPSSVTMLL